MVYNAAKAIADKLCDELMASGKTKRIKVKTLMKRFNYEKRTEESAAQITQLLFERNVLLNPSIMKIGDTWQLKFYDNVYLSIPTNEKSSNLNNESPLLENWNTDKWFDTLGEKIFRTEKEVESKFLVPLLTRLGYSENDRYDGMPVSGANGSKSRKLEVDYGLFNTDNEMLSNQVLLIAEAKREDRLRKSVELEHARNQVKSYGIFSGCLFGLITDSKKIEVIALFPLIFPVKINNEQKPLFECRVNELKDRFTDLYDLISKDSLTLRYEGISRDQDQ